MAPLLLNYPPRGSRHDALEILGLEERLRWIIPLASHKQLVRRLLVTVTAASEPSLFGGWWSETREIQIHAIVRHRRFVAPPLVLVERCVERVCPRQPSWMASTRNSASRKASHRPNAR